MLTLDVAIATHGPDGLDCVKKMELPQVPGVRYVVSWQQPVGNPASWRDDIVLTTATDATSLSANRNNALRSCRADIVLFADNDISYLPGALQAVTDAFEQYPEADFALFRYEGADNPSFPSAGAVLPPLPRFLPLISFTTAVRRSKALEFDERFGLGTSLAMGEDSLYIHTMLRLGYRGVYVPRTIVSHPHLTTSFRALGRDTLAAGGVIAGMIYPFSSIARIPLMAYRYSRAGLATFPAAFAGLAAGWMRQLTMKRPWNRPR